MSLHTLNYSSHLLGSLSKQRILHKTRMNPVSASMYLKTDESDDDRLDSIRSYGSNSALMSSKNPTKDSLICQPNAVGIIGGSSADAMLNFVKKLVKFSNGDEEDGNGIPFVLCSDPDLERSLLRHECSFSLMGKSEISQIVEKLRHKRVWLERSGARCIVMPCHISNLWYNEVSKGSSVPLLHIGECVAEELKNANLKPLEAGSPLRIGLLATNTTLQAGFYQEKLQEKGFEVVVPDKATMEHTVIPSMEAIARKDMEGARNLLRIALQVLLVRAVNTIILASDDMRSLLPQDDPLLKKCVDPFDSFARSTLKLAQSSFKDI